MAKKYVLKLTAAERAELEAVTKRGRASVRKVQKARAMLLADQGEHGPAWIDTDIAEEVGTSVRSLESWRKRACEDGPTESLTPRPREWKPERKLDGRQEAELCRIACSTPPAGRQRWSIRLLADRLVELDVVDTISRETVRKGLQKTRLNLG